MTDSNPRDFTPPTTPPVTPLYEQTAGATASQEHPSSTSGKADTAKREAAGVAGDAQDATKHVASVTKDQAANVVGEAKSQFRDLADQTTSQLKDQAGVQQQKVSEGLRSVSDELSSMADRSEGSGIATELVRNLSGRAGSAAGWLDGRDPGSLLDEVKSFAARKPGTFIAIAAGAGILAGRLAKALAADAKSDASEARGATTPTAPAPAPETHYEPPIRTEAAFADRSETIGSARDFGSSEPTFDDLLGDTVVPGHRIGDGEDR